MFNTIDISATLIQTVIDSKAPCRVDFGGFWDAKATALISRYVKPRTVNIALDLPLTVTLYPFTRGKIKVTSDGYLAEVHEAANAPLNSPFALVFAICRFFNISGVHVQVVSAFPSQSGLGGSGVLAVALIHSINKALCAGGHDADYSLKNIVRLAHDIEDGLRLSFTGLQDQAAAAFGGANLWSWHYDEPNTLFQQDQIWDPSRISEASAHLLVAYTGAAHSSNDANLKTLECFLSGQRWKEWETINNLTSDFANALRNWDWKTAIGLMREEVDIRRRITPSTLTDSTLRFIAAATELSCAARFAGAGGGGCVWAIGTLNDVHRLATAWSELAGRISGAKLLTTNISPVGVI